MKKTAVEWLVNQMNKKGFNLDKMDLNIFQQAKEMEKQQIIDAANHGANYENSPFVNAEQYYNETFKQTIK
jgi:chemotaxis receptor (MCP) glutamine deamidase CheD